MKKNLLLFLLLLIGSTNIYAQKDTEHWFAPFWDKADQGYDYYIYVSTDSVTPFNITVKKNGTTIGTIFNVSNGMSQSYQIAESDLVITDENSLFTTLDKGLHLEANTPFFASLRMSNTVHAEIVASKGKAALGTTFYSVNAPSQSGSSLLNYTTSVYATQDNTTVTVSGYDPTVDFSGTSAPTGTSFTFTLDKDESYIIGGPGTSGRVAKFIGAKITSDKPILTMNGNSNGQYVNTNFGTDLIMDQNVPIDKLGDEFAMVKGNGGATSGLEGGLVVATQDNTQVFVNNETTPITILNEGEHFVIPGGKYINQGSDHYNMFVKSTKPIYLYQLLGGGSSLASPGYNYIPPLNCYLPREIDEIAKVNEISPVYSPSGLLIKLNVLTEAGATVTYNGAAIPATQGPYALTGTTNWVSYSIPGVSGNAKIVSDKAVTAGISGGYSTAGYGGYFAGFSTVPSITKNTVECIPGIVLEVPDIYETYQWYFDGVPLPNAGTNTLTPTEPGNYTCTVSITGCDPVTTSNYKVYPCPTASTTDRLVCGVNTSFTPTFTYSTQTVDLGGTLIATPPSNGSVSIDPATGIITYTPTAGFAGTDSFVYEVRSNIPEFGDREFVTVNLNVVRVETFPSTLNSCPYEGKATYDLTSAGIVTPNPNLSFKYYPTLGDLYSNINEITNPTAYSSAEGNVYALVITPEGCTVPAKIDLAFLPVPEVYANSITECYYELPAEDVEIEIGGVKINSDTYNNDMAIFDLTIPIVSSNPADIREYYPTLKDAENQTNIINFPNNYLSQSGTVYVRVSKTTGCFDIAKITLNVKLPKKSSVLKDQIICINDRATLDAGPGYDSYEWSTGDTTQSIIGAGVGEYFVILGHDGCKTKQNVNIYKSENPVFTDIAVKNNQATLQVAGGYPPYLYSIDGVTWQESNVFTDLPRGLNKFYVKDTYDCDPVSIEITIPNFVNAITPNGDGINDVIDYSALSYKKNLRFDVYDRYGTKIHTADRNNGYKWNGTKNNRQIHTDTYWYSISWEELDEFSTKVEYTGWVLVKNRN